MSSTPTIRTLIAEDEPLAAQSLAAWVSSKPELELIGCVGDGETALEMIKSEAPDLLLLDIQMPEMTGLQVVKRLIDEGRTLPAVVFTTAYDEYALTAFELHAVDYLLKPFSRERFDDAIAHVGHRIEAAQHGQEEGLKLAVESGLSPSTTPMQRILIRDQGKIFPLQTSSIEYLRSDTKYTAIVSKGRTFLVRLPIQSLEARLDPQQFLRVQRSFIINLDFVESMTPNETSQLEVQMLDGTRITASRDVSKRLRGESL